MNEKGRQTKLLAAIAVLAMVVCVFAVVASSENVSAAPDTSMPTDDDGDGVITLDNDVVLSETYTVPTDIDTIDLGGHTITCSSSTNGIIIPAGCDVAIDNGTITAANPTVQIDVIRVMGSATLGSSLAVTLTGTFSWDNDYYFSGLISIFGGDVTINGSKMTSVFTGICLYNEDYPEYLAGSVGAPTQAEVNKSAPSTLTINDGEFTAGFYTISGNNQFSAGSVIDINGGTFKSTVDTEGCFYLPMQCEVTIDDAHVEGATAIGIRMGSLTITNSEIVATGEATDYDGTGSGFSANGSAIIVLSQFYGTSAGMYNDNPDLNVMIGEGTTVTSENNASVDIVNGGVNAADVQDATIDIQVSVDSVRIFNAANKNPQAITNVSVDDVNSLAINGKADITTKGNVIIAENSAISDNLTVSEGSNVTFSNDITNSGTVTNGGSVNIQSGVEFTNSGTFINSADARINLYGIISGSKITNDGTIAYLSQDADVTADVGGSGSLDTSAVSENATVGGTLLTPNTSFGPNQIVTVTDGYLTLTKGTTLTIEGTLIIPEGTTVTVQNGAKLIINGQSANVDNDGSIIVESENGFEITGGAVVINDGTITAQFMASAPDYKPMDVITIDADSTVTNNGTLTIGIESGLVLNGKIVNSSGALVTLNGKVSGGSGSVIENAGTVTIYAETSGTLTISNSAVDATVQVTSIIGTAVQIDDALIEDEEIDNTEKNVIRLVGTAAGMYRLGGVTVTSVTYDDTENGETVTYKALDISGTITATYTGNSDSDTIGRNVIGITLAGKIIVSESLTTCNALNVNIGYNSTPAEIMIAGTLEFAKGTVFSDGIVTGSEIAVSGTMTSINTNLTTISGLTVHAAYYRTTDGTDSVYTYTTLEAAVAAGQTSITVNGYIDVDSDVTIPSGTTVYQNSGSRITVSEDVMLTFANGSRLNQTAPFDAANFEGINVEGTVYVENVRGTYGTISIHSQVYSTTGTDARYTSLVNAMESATSGTVIELYNKPVVIDKTSFTIKEGVTVDTNDQDFTVNGSTLTINGTLYVTSGTTYVVQNDDDTGFNYVSSIILNGYIKTDAKVMYSESDLRYPAGAYYALTEEGVTAYYITTVANAAEIISTVDESTVELYGELSIGSLEFTGAEDEQAIVNIYGNITAGTVTLNMADVVYSGGTFIGTIANSNGSFVFDKNVVAASGTKVSAYVDENGNDNLALTGETSAGNIVANGGTLIGNATRIFQMTVDGTVSIEDANITITTLIVNGTVNVNGGGILQSTTTTINGTLQTQVATSEVPEQGSVTIGTLYAGVALDKGKIVDGTAGEVIGNVSVSGIAYVSADSTVPENMTADKDSTEFYVEGVLWITAYGNGEASVNNAPVTDADFLGWKDENGDMQYYVTAPAGEPDAGLATEIAVGTPEKLYADVEYNVYNVTVYTDGGIASVAIDGNILAGNDNVFSTGGNKIAAGEHRLTYTLKNGFQGEAVMTIDGQTISGDTFTISGDNRNIVINLAGTEPADQTIVVEGGSNGDGGLGLTDILLIILVILIVVMAIIVALRLMRS